MSLRTSFRHVLTAPAGQRTIAVSLNRFAVRSVPTRFVNEGPTGDGSIGKNIVYEQIRRPVVRFMDQPATLLERAFFHFFNFWRKYFPIFIVSFVVVWWMWGGFNGELPPPRPSILVMQDE